MSDSSALLAGAQATSGVAGAYGEYKSGKDNAAVDRWNAKAAELQANQALLQGGFQREDYRRGVRRLKSSQRAAAAASGVVIDQDTQADIGTATDIEAARGEQTIANNAALEAWGYRVQAADDRNRAQITRREANNRAVGSLLTTTARFGQTYNETDGFKPLPKKKP